MPDRTWPYFRDGGIVLAPSPKLPSNRVVPPGMSLVNGSVEFTTTVADTQVVVVGKGNTTLLRLVIKRPAGTHVVAAWGEPFISGTLPVVYINGTLLTWEETSKLAFMTADAQNWTNNPAEFISVRAVSGSGGGVDEIRAYPFSMCAEELGNCYKRIQGQPMTALEPMAAKLDYRMSQGTLIVAFDVRSHYGQATMADLRWPGAVGAAVQLINGFAVATLNVGQLPIGQLPIRITAYSADAVVLEGMKTVFERTLELPWLNNSLGKQDKVYPPFVPVTRDGDTVYCVNRSYSLNSLGLPESIESKGEELLADSVRLELIVGGQAVEFVTQPVRHYALFDAATDAMLTTMTYTDKYAAAAAYVSLGNENTRICDFTVDPLRFGEPIETQTTWSSTTVAGGIRFDIDALFEFDGMVKYKVAFYPVGAPVDLIDRLSVAIPLKQRFASKLHALPIGAASDFRDYEVTRHLPETSGVIWDSKSGFAETSMAVGNFIGMAWLSGETRGLCWFADNDRGWVPNNNFPAVTIEHSADVNTLRLNLISEPFTIDKPRTVTFAILATPTKPLPANYRVYARGDTKHYPLIAGRLNSCDSFAPWKTPARSGDFDVWPTNYDFAAAATAAAAQRGSGGKYPVGGPLLIYQDKRLGNSGRDGEYFNWEWRTDTTPTNQDWSVPSLIDWRVWYFNEYLRNNIYDGIYLDDIFPIASTNAVTGSAYRLENGKLQRGGMLFGFRELAKRIWQVFGAQGKVPLFTCHATSTVPIPALSFCTTMFDGEDSMRFHPPRDFLDLWPMERMQFLDDPATTGLTTMMMCKSDYSDAYPLDAVSQFRFWRAVWAGLLLHDCWYAGNPTGSGFAYYSPIPGSIGTIILKPLQQYLGPDCTFIPYYRADEKFQVASQLLAPLALDNVPATFWRAKWSAEYCRDLLVSPCKASVYAKANSLLVVIGNYAKVAVPTKTVLDLTAVGVPVGVPVMTFADVDDWPQKEPEANQAKYESGAIECVVPGHAYRIFELKW